MSNRAFWSFLGGLATGLAIGILYAPDSGKNTREKLKIKLDDYWVELKEILKKKQEAVFAGSQSTTDSPDMLSSVAGKADSLISNEDYTRAEELLREVETLLGDMKKS